MMRTIATAGSRFPVPGTRFPVSGTRYPVPGRRCAIVVSALLVACASPPVGSAPAPIAPPVNTAETDIAPDAVADTLLTEVRSLDPTIVVELRYATANNFTGAPLPGYLANRAYLRREAAAALARVQ